MRKYDIWHEDGRLQHLESNKKLSLKSLQTIVGGYIEVVSAGKTTFIVDEEGLLKNRAQNPAFPAFVGTVISTQNGI
jgi:hypothetical protein